MQPKDADWMANSVDPDQSLPPAFSGRLIWVYTGCSVIKNWFPLYHAGTFSGPLYIM